MMSTFEYISVLLSIVVGLGLARLLTGVGQALEARRRIRFYWVQGVWVVNLVLLLVSFWWATLYGHSDRQTWLFPNFAVLLVYSILLFLGTVLIIPSDLEKSNDLKAHFFEVRPWFFGISAFIPVMELADTLLHGGFERVLAFGPYFILLLSGSFVMCLIGAMTASRTFHAIWAVVFLFIMTGWEVLRFWSIG